MFVERAKTSHIIFIQHCLPGEGLKHSIDDGDSVTLKIEKRGVVVEERTEAMTTAPSEIVDEALDALPVHCSDVPLNNFYIGKCLKTVGGSGLRLLM